MPPSSAAMELKVLISVLQNGTALKNLLADTKALNTALTDLQNKSKDGGGEAETKIRNVGDAGERSAKGIETLNAAMNKLTSTAKFLAGGFLALESVKFIKELADTAARTEVLGTVLHVVALNAGITAKEIDAVDKKVQSLGITAQASRQSLTQLLQARIKLEYAPQLARAAQDLAVIAGGDSSTAFERLVTSIQHLNTISLRSMGIVVNRTQAEQKFKEAIGATGRVLNEQEKQEALTQEVLAKAVLLQGTYESAMNNAGKQLTSLTRLTETYKQTLGNSLLPAYSAIIANVTVMFEKLNVVAEEFSANTERGQQLAEVMDSLSSAFGDTAVFLMEHLGVIINLAEAYLAVKTALFALNAASSYLKWVQSSTEWVNLAIRAWNLWQASTISFSVALKALGATSVAEAAKILTVAESQAAVATTAGPAAAGIVETGVAATTTTFALNGLAIAWGSLAAMIALPLVGYIIYKIAAEEKEQRAKGYLVRAGEVRESFGGKPLTMEDVNRQGLRSGFEEWKRDNSIALQQMKDEAEVIAEYNRAITAAMKSKQRSSDVIELGKAREEMQAAITEQQQVLHSDKPAGPELEAAKNRVDAATTQVKTLSEKNQKNFEATITNVSRESLLRQIAEVQTLKREQGKVDADKGASRGDVAAAHAAVELEGQRLKVMQKVHQQQMEMKAFTDPEREADEKANAQARDEINKTTEAADRLSEAKRNLVGEKFEFTEEGISSGGFSKIVSGYTEVLTQARQAFEKDGEVPRDMADALQKGMIELGQAAKTPLDFSNLQKQIAASGDLGKAVPGLRQAASDARELARLNVERTRLQDTAPIVAARKEQVTERTTPAIQEAQHALNQEKITGAAEQSRLEDQYKQGLVELDKYYEGRQAIIQWQGDAELEFEKRKIDQMKALQAEERDPKAFAAAQRSIDAAEEQQEVRKAQIQAEIDKLDLQREGRRRELRLQVTTATLAEQAALGGLAEAQAQLNAQLEQEAKKYAELGDGKSRAQADELLRLKRITGEFEIQKRYREQILQIELGVEKAYRDQLDFQQQQRGVEAAQDQAAVARGAMTDIQAMRRNNVRVQQDMDANRAKSLSLQRDLVKQLADKERDLAAIEYEAYGTGIDNSEKLAQAEQQHNDQILATRNSIISLDTAYASLGSSIQTNSQAIRQSIESAFEGAITDSIMQVKKMGDIWKSMAQSITQSIVQMFVKAFTQRLFQETGLNRLMTFLSGVGMSTAGSVAGGVAGPNSSYEPGGVNFSGPILVAAQGGPVRGPGTGTSDSIPAMVSAGEHIMPADKASQWMPLLESIRLGKILPAYALGGVVAVQSIALSPVIPRRYASGGVVVADGGAASVTPGGGGSGHMIVSLHPDAMNMTLREWLEHEVVRQQGRR